MDVCVRFGNVIHQEISWDKFKQYCLLNMSHVYHTLWNSIGIKYFGFTTSVSRILPYEIGIYDGQEPQTPYCEFIFVVIILILMWIICHVTLISITKCSQFVWFVSRSDRSQSIWIFSNIIINVLLFKNCRRIWMNREEMEFRQLKTHA